MPLWLCKAHRNWSMCVPPQKASVQALMAGIHAIRPGVSQRSVEAIVVNCMLERRRARRVVLAVVDGRAEWRLPDAMGFENPL